MPSGIGWIQGLMMFQTDLDHDLWVVFFFSYIDCGLARIFLRMQTPISVYCGAIQNHIYLSTH